MALEKRSRACEPENRLVARTLERRWDEALQASQRLEAEYERFTRTCPRPLGEEDRASGRAVARPVSASLRKGGRRGAFDTLGGEPRDAVRSEVPGPTGPDGTDQCIEKRARLVHDERGCGAVPEEKTEEARLNILRELQQDSDLQTFFVGSKTGTPVKASTKISVATSFFRQ